MALSPITAIRQLIQHFS